MRTAYHVGAAHEPVYLDVLTLASKILTGCIAYKRKEGIADRINLHTHPLVYLQATVVDIRTLGSRKSSKERQLVVDAALATRDQDNERFLKLLRARMDRQAPV